MRELRLTDEMRYVLEHGIPGKSSLSRTDANSLPFQYANALTILLTEGLLYWSGVHKCYYATARGIARLEHAPAPDDSPADDDSEEA